MSSEVARVTKAAIGFFFPNLESSANTFSGFYGAAGIACNLGIITSKALRTV